MLLRATAALLVFAAPFLSAGTIRLKSRRIETTAVPASWSVFPERRLNPGRRHVIAEFQAPVTGGLVASLRARGVLVTSGLGSRALMLAVPDNASITDLGVDWLGQLEPADKWSSELDRWRPGIAAYVVEFHKDVARFDAETILKRNGLETLSTGRMLPNQAVVTGNRESLLSLARWDEVAYIFPASNELLARGDVRPCYGALSQGETVAQYVKVGDGWTLNGPGGLSLEYVFTTLTDKLSAAQTQTEIVRAMHEWSRVANVQFTEGSDGGAPWTIAIEFGTAVNNDPTPFDPSGSVLAHTYYPAPPNPEPIAGDMHFNPAENWHVGASVDVYSVALHELGHALGLGHTDNPADVMYPYYRFGAGLSTNDIAGVQSLYGAPGSIASGSPGDEGDPEPVPMTPKSPLALNITSPANGARTSAASTTLSGTLLNASAGATVSWQTSRGLSGLAAGSSNWSTSPVPLAPGINLITVSASDAGKSTANALVRVTRTGGGSGGGAPAGGSVPGGSVPGGSQPVAITSPPDGSVATAPAIVISGTATDSSGIAQITWETNSGASGIASGAENWSASAVPVFPGQNVIVIRAYSNSGSMRWAAITVTKN